MKVALASDHRGFKLKEFLKRCLEVKGYQFHDFGTHSQGSCDYPDYGKLAVKSLQRGEADFAILICGSGIGMSILANKFKGIRAALCLSPRMARMAREHNNANVLVLAGDFLSYRKARRILDAWLRSNFQGGRHERRINKIKELEEGDEIISTR